MPMFKNIYQNKKVLVTGHTGFKGSWLAMWLLELGADVVGYALEPPTEPNHFNLVKVDVRTFIGDVRDIENVKKIFKEQKPDIVFHLAAQPIVRLSYEDPVHTFTTNVMGTINVLEATREVGTVQAFINVTSDKCYENREWTWGYREIDRLGGYDPYSVSKGCSELINSCWRNSFFNSKGYGLTHQTLLASGRAGNVIGGGDWAIDRLVPDIMRAAGENKKAHIRNPHAIRAWQHVLEPLSGYLLLGQKLLEGLTEFAEAWNFGPPEHESFTVGRIAEMFKKEWPKVVYEKSMEEFQQLHETGVLKLDCSKARSRLQWSPVWDGNETVKQTVLWYEAFYETGEIKSSKNLQDYIADAKNEKILWAIT